ncbi:MAG: hypothetical protein JEZ07_09655 [Phycisphaerae bacterium]|nr:hypothetical protein [Phycisphaerae bacterium]
MISLAQYRKRFIFVCILQGFCATGTFFSYLLLVKSISGDLHINKLAIGSVLIGCFCVGLMSPQWLIRRLLSWCRRFGARQAEPVSWLPDSQGDPAAIGTALSGMILIYALLAVLVTLVLPLVFKFHDWVEYHFFLGVVSGFGFDLFVLILLLGPVWFAFGIAVDLLYRLGLTFTTMTGVCRRFDRNIPVFLFAGIVLGIPLWQLSILVIKPIICVWMAQTISVFCVIVLLFLPLRIAWQTRRNLLDDSTIILDKVRPAKLPRVVAVLLCGVLVGLIFTMFRVVTTATENRFWSIAYDSAVLMALTVGMYIVFRKNDNDSRKLRWLYGGLAFTVLLFICAFKCEIPGNSINDSIMVSMAFAMVLMASTGSIIAYSKHMVQEVSVSRCLGWARWLALLGLGIIVAQIMFIVAR